MIQYPLRHLHRIPVPGLSPPLTHLQIRTDLRPGTQYQVPLFQQQPAGHILHLINHIPDLPLGFHQPVRSCVPPVMRNL